MGARHHPPNCVLSVSDDHRQRRAADGREPDAEVRDGLRHCQRDEGLEAAGVLCRELKGTSPGVTWVLDAQQTIIRIPMSLYVTKTLGCE